MVPSTTVALDLSRLLSRADRDTATGIDRVELAYAEHLLRSEPDSCFAALGPFGRIGLLPRGGAAAFIAGTAAVWRGEATARRPRIAALARRLRIGLTWRGTGALAARLQRAPGVPVYLLVSHHHLDRPRAILQLKQRTGARFVCLIHDLIPIQYPEYARPGRAAQHLRRIETAVALSDGLIVTSAVTRDALQPHIERTGRNAPVLVAPFGVDLPAPGGVTAAGEARSPPDRPYFVYVSTIEARKNHLLLLNMWRRLAEEFGRDAPRLVLIGQRGWEVEAVIDMLERCPALRDVVLERNRLPDAEMVRLLRGARAVLLPSFAEGFGFPLVEGFALGVPALCSDIPALRETGGAVPDYVDPLDGMGWRAAVLDYAAADSPRREAQLARLAQWHPVRWSDHFAAVEALVAEVAARG